MPRNPPLPRLFFQAAGVTFQLPREGRRACLSVVCSLLLFSLLSFFRAGGDPVDPTRAHFRAHRCANRRCFSSSVSRTNCGNRDHTLRSGFSSALVCRLSRAANFGDKFSENRRLVVGTEIDFVEVEKFPRASSSSAGRPRQVAADRARAGEKFLMAHFPASLSVNRLAGSSGTQKVCESTKSRNRTGSVISKSRPGLSQMPAAMTQRGLKHQSEGSSRSVAVYLEAAGVRNLVVAMSLLKLIASCPPSRPRNGTTSFTVTASLT